MLLMGGEIPIYNQDRIVYAVRLNRAQITSKRALAHLKKPQKMDLIRVTGFPSKGSSE
jgi:hypothetical protein